jgi:hypothetical protein
MKEYVVDFHLPGDGIFDHHGTNFVGRSKKEAREAVERHIPGASVLSVSEGMICLYGAPYANYDALGGAYCTPKKDPATP